VRDPDLEAAVSAALEGEDEEVLDVSVREAMEEEVIEEGEELEGREVVVVAAFEVAERLESAAAAVRLGISSRW